MVSQVCCSECVEVTPHSTGAVLVSETSHRKEGRQSSSTHVPGDCGDRRTRLPCPTLARHTQSGSVPVYGRLQSLIIKTPGVCSLDSGAPGAQDVLHRMWGPT